MRPVFTFVVLAYLLSWGAWLPVVLSGEQVLAGQGWPTHMPGLVGPAVAAIVAAWFMGRAARTDLWQRCRTLPRGFVAWAVTLSPLVMAGVALATDRMVSGRWPDLSVLGHFSGLPVMGVLPVLAVLLIVNGFGEEIGWRGFLLPRLQARFGVLGGTLALWPVWLFWHLPLFVCLGDFHAMGPGMVVGWALGLLAGTLVLAHVSHIAGRSVPATALWHVLFNLAAGPALSPLSAAVATTVVILWAAGIAIAAWRGGAGFLSVTDG